MVNEQIRNAVLSHLKPDNQFHVVVLDCYGNWGSSVGQLETILERIAGRPLLFCEAKTNAFEKSELIFGRMTDRQELRVWHQSVFVFHLIKRTSSATHGGYAVVWADLLGTNW